MKAISLWQPYAALCVIAAKQYETRRWGTSYRGPLLIHAAKKCDRAILIAMHGLAPILIPLGIYGPADLSFGTLIGRVQLVA